MPKRQVILVSTLRANRNQYDKDDQLVMKIESKDPQARGSA
jgi:hypothetical protein